MSKNDEGSKLPTELNEHLDLEEVRENREKGVEVEIAVGHEPTSSTTIENSLLLTQTKIVEDDNEPPADLSCPDMASVLIESLSNVKYDPNGYCYGETCVSDSDTTQYLNPISQIQGEYYKPYDMEEETIGSATTHTSNYGESNIHDIDNTSSKIFNISFPKRKKIKIRLYEGKS